MGKYIDADRLKEEVEKKYNSNDTVSDRWDLGYDTACEQILDIIDSLQQEQPDFPTTDEEIERFLATHPKVEVPQKYKTPDWLFKKQEQSAPYDEAYLNEKIAKATKSWEGVDVDKFMDEVRGREPEVDLDEEINRTCHNGSVADTSDLDHNSYENIARHFAKWQKEQMMSEAVEGEAHPDDCEIWVNLVGYGYKFNEGDKVRIIIVKEN